jgi:hypothetical protein
VKLGTVDVVGARRGLPQSHRAQAVRQAGEAQKQESSRLLHQLAIAQQRVQALKSTAAAAKCVV